MNFKILFVVFNFIAVFVNGSWRHEPWLRSTNQGVGQVKFKRVLIDGTYINEIELQTLRNWLKNQSGLSQGQLNRIVEININL